MDKLTLLDGVVFNIDYRFDDCFDNRNFELINFKNLN